MIPLWSGLKVTCSRRQMLPHYILVESHAETRAIGNFNPAVLHDWILDSLLH